MNVLKFRSFISLGFILLGLISCQEKASKNDDSILAGDIVFVPDVSSPLTEAIDQVTETTKASNYTHMGVIDSEEGVLSVIHSDSDRGVVSESLNEFSSRYDSLHIYRWVSPDDAAIEAALLLGRSLEGAPYNFSYIIEDSGYYCSELVYTLFEKAGVFSLNPMTFKDPATDTFAPYWIGHYESLNIPVPEGKLGCNPNEMATSSNLKFIKGLKRGI